MNATLRTVIADLKARHADSIKVMQAALFEKNIISIAGECFGIQSVITDIRFSQRYSLTDEDRQELALLEDELRAEQRVAQEEAFARVLKAHEHLNQGATNDAA